MCTRAADAMFSLTTSWMPHATSVSDRPTRLASRSSAARAAGEVVGVQIAEQEVRVGHGRLGAAEPVGGRTRVRARAARADLEQPDLVDGGDGAAAGPDLDQLDGGDADGQP